MLNENGRPKTGKSKRDLIVHEGLGRMLRDHTPPRFTPEDFVFKTPRGAPIDEANFHRREWLGALRALRVSEPRACRPMRW